MKSKTAKRVTVQPLAPDKTAAQLDSRRLDDAGLKKFLETNLGHQLQNWPETNWDFQELTLVAFYFHPSLEVARAQWLVAQAGLKTAGAMPNPSVSVAPGYDSQIPGNAGISSLRSGKSAAAAAAVQAILM